MTMYKSKVTRIARATKALVKVKTKTSKHNRPPSKHPGPIGRK